MVNKINKFNRYVARFIPYIATKIPIKKNIAPMIKQKSDAELLKNEVFRVRK
ncbi:hypothetical protein APW63_00370 [Staphylococcus aureus]|nr:hypothetical protein APW39_10840 [Staphylococcus aureus]OLN57234.1 hypothetical protein APW63_00370 [Staphylococcus aureus]OLN67560.1 hypothetical protein APW84_04100 [Staphylococcus aureus]PAJ18675.1 hypothetical protein APW98_02620 [Staphylococcus aureus]